LAVLCGGVTHLLAEPPQPLAVSPLDTTRLCDAATPDCQHDVCQHDACLETAHSLSSNSINYTCLDVLCTQALALAISGVVCQISKASFHLRNRQRWAAVWLWTTCQSAGVANSTVCCRRCPRAPSSSPSVYGSEQPRVPTAAYHAWTSRKITGLRLQAPICRQTR